MVKYYFLFFILFPQLLMSQTWIRKDMGKLTSDVHIEIHYRYILKDGFKFLEFKGETIMNSNLTNLVLIVGNVSKMHEWVYNLESAKCEIINDKERYIYMVHKSNIFLSQRDSYAHTIASQNPHSFEVVIKGTSVPERGPEKDAFVRIKKGESQWRFYPLDVDKTKVTFQGYADLGGNIRFDIFLPFAKKKLLKVPFESLSNLIKIVEHGDIKAKQSDWIINYK